MARTEETAETVNLPTVGQEGDVCSQCGSVLAVDQRYCVNCGTRRSETRVDYQRQLAGNGAQSAGGIPGAGPAAGAPQWSSPIVAIGAIAVLGVMLLLGVLIGNDNDGQQVVAGAAAPTVASTPTETTPTKTTPTKAPAAAPAPKKAAASTAAGQGNVEQGGSGSTEGVPAADVSRQGGGSVLENAKNGPGQVATQGEPEKLDPSGPAGGGSDATCIGC
jgi:hypothetical protein